MVDPSLVQELVRARRWRDPLDVLSPRERDVLALMAEGASNAGIARRIFVTEGTVEKHVRSILTKLNLPESATEHRRVLAVLLFAGATAAGFSFTPSAAGLVFAAVLLVILFGTVFAAVHHAEVIAERIGEPYGTLLLTLAVTIIEVALIATIMLGEKEVPTLARVANNWSMNTDTMGVYGNYYLKRAIVSQLGLGANLPEDAIYPLNLADDTGKPLEQFTGEMQRSPDAGRAVGHLAGVGLGARDEVGHRAVGRRIRHRHDVRVDAHQRHRREVGHRIVADRRIDELVDRVPDRADVDRVAVRLRVEHRERRGLQACGSLGVRHVRDFLLEEIVLAPGEFRELLHALLGLPLLCQGEMLPDLSDFLLLQVP